MPHIEAGDGVVLPRNRDVVGPVSRVRLDPDGPRVARAAERDIVVRDVYVERGRGLCPGEPRSAGTGVLLRRAERRRFRVRRVRGANTIGVVTDLAYGERVPAVVPAPSML